MHSMPGARGYSGDATAIQGAAGRKASTVSTWFITGASRGFGARLAAGALAAGDAVIATAREPQAYAAAEAAITPFGRIDVLQQFLDEVINPFNARLATPLVPTVRGIYGLGSPGSRRRISVFTSRGSNGLQR